MCQNAGKELVLNIRTELRNFLKGGMPFLETSSTKALESTEQKAIQDKIIKPISNDKKDKQSLLRTGDNSEAWTFLYNTVTPAILHAATINNHPQELRLIAQIPCYLIIHE